MLKFRSLTALLALLLCVAFAPPSMAAQPTKQWAVAYQKFIPAGNGIVIPTKVYNLTPNGNSYINSIKLFPAPGVSFAYAVGVPTQIQTLQPAGTATATLNADGSLFINNMAGIGPNFSMIFNVSVNVSSASSCAAAGWPTPVATTGNSLNGDPFLYLFNATIPPANTTTYSQLNSLINCDGTVNCGDTITTVALKPDGTGVQSAKRTTENKDGNACVLVGYSFLDKVISGTSDYTLFQWDLNTQSTAAFIYTVFWLPEVADPTTGLPTSVTKVAWKGTNGQLANDGSFLPGKSPVPAQACIDPDGPTTMGTLLGGGTNGLGGQVTATDTTIYVQLANGVALPTGSFPIHIDRERIVVTGVSGNAWTVMRGQGNTAATTHDLTYANSAVAKKVMSNPMPVYADPTNGNIITEMQMCLMAQGFMAVDRSLCSITDATSACVQKWSTALDSGDSFMTGR